MPLLYKTQQFCPCRKLSPISSFYCDHSFPHFYTTRQSVPSTSREYYILFAMCHFARRWMTIPNKLPFIFYELLQRAAICIQKRDLTRDYTYMERHERTSAAAAEIFLISHANRRSSVHKKDYD
jgi:hypothetical protein